MTRQLPGLLADIEAAAGTAKALELARQCGGCQISLSAAPTSTLVKVVGLEAAQKIVDALGHGRVIVPMANLRGQGARQAAAAQMLVKGASARQVALACDVHTRTAWRVKARAKEAIDLARKNGDLFGED